MEYIFIYEKIKFKKIENKFKKFKKIHRKISESFIIINFKRNYIHIYIGYTQ